MSIKNVLVTTGLCLTTMGLASADHQAATRRTVLDSGENVRARGEIAAVKRGATVHLREVQRWLEVGPGERAFIASVCDPGEAVVGGGPTGMPASLTVTLSTLFYDGTHSGWMVEFRNDGDQTVTEYPAGSALCVRGTVEHTITSQ